MTIGRRWLAVPAIFGLVLLTAFMAGSAATASVQGARTAAAKETDKAVFFTADGMRQDIVERYADQGVMPTMADFLKKGTRASGNGLLTEAPPNTGAGWYSLATGVCVGLDTCRAGEVLALGRCMPACVAHADCVLAANYGDCCGGCDAVHVATDAADPCLATSRSMSECSVPPGACDGLGCPSPPEDCTSFGGNAVCMVDGSRAARELGFRPRHSLRETIRAVLADRD